MYPEIFCCCESTLTGQYKNIIDNSLSAKVICKRTYMHRADNNGQVDVDTMESLGGSYTGHFPMGLIGTLHPAPSEYKFTRFFKRDVLNPNVVSCVYHSFIVVVVI